MDYDSVEDLATGKWCGYWGGMPKPTKEEKNIVKFARQLKTMVDKWYEKTIGKPRPKKLIMKLGAEEEGPYSSELEIKIGKEEG